MRRRKTDNSVTRGRCLVPDEGGGQEHYLCTICCASKRKDPGLLPAVERYVSDRIAFVDAESRRLHRPLVILSGEFGLVERHEPIPWYDLRLMPETVGTLIPIVVEQLTRLRVRSLVFYAQPRPTPGWGPYYEVLERACTLTRLPLRVEILRPMLQ